MDEHEFTHGQVRSAQARAEAARGDIMAGRLNEAAESLQAAIENAAGALRNLGYTVSVSIEKPRS